MLRRLISNVANEVDRFNSRKHDCAYNNFGSISRPLFVYIFERAGIYNSKNCVQRYGHISWHTAEFEFIQRKQLFKIMKKLSFDDLSISDIMVKRVALDYTLVACNWSTNRPVFYVELSWNRFLDRACRMHKLMHHLNENIVRRSHMLGGRARHLKLYMEFVDEFSLIKVTNILRDSYRILSNEAMRISG